MSRFYDALREASRSGQSLTGSASEPEWNAIEIDGIDIPPLPDISPIPEAIETPAAAPVEPWSTPAADMDDVAALIDPLAPARPEKAPVPPVRISIDRTARLIPNVVNPAIVEHYRRLRTKILQARGTQSFRTLMVTSPSPQEGKTVTTLNLALSFAMLPGFKVAVIDGDLRRGSLGKWLGIEDHPGFGNLIEGSATLDQVICKSDDIPLHFIVAGNSTTAPAELLHSPQLAAHLRRIGEEFTLVLVDSPPVNMLTDTQLIASKCDAVLLVVRAFSTTRKSLEQAARELAPHRIIGAVMNGGVNARLNSRYGYY